MWMDGGRKAGKKGIETRSCRYVMVRDLDIILKKWKAIVEFKQGNNANRYLF